MMCYIMLVVADIHVGVEFHRPALFPTWMMSTLPMVDSDFIAFDRSFLVLCVHADCHRAVVDELNLHICSKFTCCHGFSQLF